MTSVQLSSAKLSLTLDGEHIDFTLGDTIYDVIRAAGKSVPTLCYDERLDSFGACRLCVVSVEGQGRPVASCTTPAVSGMAVTTMSPELETHRKVILEMVASENPDDGRVSELRGLASQELATLSDAYKIERRFLGVQSGTSRPDDVNPFILRDYDKCISCYRCVRVCAEQEGDYAISIAGRGFDTQITTEHGGHLRESDCTFCGQCVQTCPTGALADKKALRFADDPKPVEKTRSVCSYCGVGCSVDIMTKGDKIIGLQPAMDGPANEGALCVKGQFAYDFVQHSDRLETPYIRKNGKLVPASWDDALRVAAEGFSAARKKYGRYATYAVASGRAPSESAYLTQKFIRANNGTHYVDNCSRG